jgi:hypothetical protein
VVSQVDRLRQRLEAECVPREAGDGQRADDRAERDDEIGVVDPEHPLLGLDLYAPGCRVMREDLAEDEVGVGAHHS